MFVHHPSPIQEIIDPFFSSKSVRLFVKRDDLIHPLVSGNKWFKLKKNIDYILSNSTETYHRILSFGGAYSNHLHALAAIGNKYQIPTVGFVRGEMPINSPLSPTLRDAQNWGMHLVFVSRSEYKNRCNYSWLEELKEQWQAFIVPEGGSNLLAVQGVAEMIQDEIKEDYDFVLVPVGSGGTLAGIIQGMTELQAKTQIVGISVLKGAEYLESKIKDLLGDGKQKSFCDWSVNHQYHFGGYAKFSLELVEFMRYFESRHRIPIEPIYSGKMFYGLYHLHYRNFFPEGSRILILHTGGLQGLRGMKSKIEALQMKSAISPHGFVPFWLSHY